MNSRTVIIIEPFGMGHKLLHCRRIARGLIERGLFVIIATLEDSFNHPLIEDMKLSFNKKIEILKLPNMKKYHKLMESQRWFIRQIGYYFWFKLILKDVLFSIKPNFVFIPYLDYMIYALGVFKEPFFKISWGGLVMSLPFGIREKNIKTSGLFKLYKLQSFFFNRMINRKKNGAIFCIQEPVVEYLYEINPISIEKFIYVPDPVHNIKLVNKEEAGKKLNIDYKKKIILVYGEISLRKGVKNLIEAIKYSNDINSLTIVLAGRHTNDVKVYLKTLWPKDLLEKNIILSINKFIDDEEESYLFSISDLVWVAYNNFYLSSGVLYLAANAGKPVLGSDEGIISWIINKYNIGEIVNLDNSKEIYNSINSILTNEKQYYMYKNNSIKLGEKHNEKYFINKIVDNIINNIN